MSIAPHARGMKVLFRVDAGPTTSGGHVMRCMTLAAALVRRGAEVAFLTREGTTATVPALARSGWRTLIVGAAPEETLAAAASIWTYPADLIVIDSYAISRADEVILSGCAGRLMTITDIVGEPHDCDLLLDHNVGRTSTDYRGRVPEHAVICAGSSYALLRPQFAIRRDEALARRRQAGPVRRVLITLGLSHVGNLTSRVALAALEALPEATIDVVVGTEGGGIAALAGTTPNLRLLRNVEDMCSLMIEADLAIGAAGTTAWERCCLGLPSIALILADNQRPIAMELTNRCAIVAIEAGSDDLDNLLRQGLRQLAANNPDRMRMVNCSADVTDGHGADRVVEAIHSLCRAARFA